MTHQDLLKCFQLQAELNTAVYNWIKNITKNSKYKNAIPSINNVALLSQSTLGVSVDFCVPPMYDYVEEKYMIDMNDLISNE